MPSLETRLLKLELPHLTGKDVFRLQRALGIRGAVIEADGKFGFNTDRAVRRFQQEHGLEVNGIVDEATANLLFSRSTIPPLPKLRLPNFPVLNLQRALKQAGLAVEIDGELGDKTKKALKEFQRRKGLKQSGEADESTWKALRSEGK